MKKERLLIFALVSIFLTLSNSSLVLGLDPVGNQVGAQIRQLDIAGSHEDYIGNETISWTEYVLLYLHNTPDGGGPLISPTVQLQSDLPFIDFRPDDPTFFSAQPEIGQYEWDFSGMELVEPAERPLDAILGYGILDKTGFELSREITPEILTNDVSFQTVKIRFTLTEPLPAGVNNIYINTEVPIVGFQDYPLVTYEFVSQSSLEGWNDAYDPFTAGWNTSPENVQIGKTYEFEAILKAVKSNDLLGSPISKPRVSIVRGRMLDDGAPVTSNSIELVLPGKASATFSAENVVDWTSHLSDLGRDFHLTPVVSEFTPPPPPFHVLIPADVRIEPEVLKLGSKGVITAFIKLPEQYSISEVNLATVTSQGALAVKAIIDGDKLIVKFNREELQNIQPGEDVELSVKGELRDGTVFEGSDIVKVIE